MSNFRGTRGKWVLGGISGRMIKSTDREEFGFIADVDTKANALLISKAPEMLEMLEKCKEYFLLKTDRFSEERAEAIGQLIKEATEL